VPYFNLSPYVSDICKWSFLICFAFIINPNSLCSDETLIEPSANMSTDVLYSVFTLLITVDTFCPSDTLNVSMAFGHPYILPSLTLIVPYRGML